MQQASPADVMDQAVNRAVAPRAPYQLPAHEALMRLSTADFARVLKPALTTSPLEITIVGDVDEARAVALVARTFGALPARHGPATAHAGDWRLRFGAGYPRQVSATHDGPPQKALVGAVWPLFVGDPSLRRDELTAGLVRDLLDAALTERLRTQLSETYTPHASLDLDDHGDQGELVVKIDAAPADVANLRAEALKVAAQLARGAVAETAFAEVRTPALSLMDRKLHSNAHWADQLEDSAASPAAAAELASDRDTLAAISLSDVRQAAARWLSQAPVVVTVTGAPAAPTAMAGASTRRPGG
jgi:zinc protease